MYKKKYSSTSANQCSVTNLFKRGDIVIFAICVIPKCMYVCMDATCKCGNSEQMCGAVYLPTYSSILARSVTPPPIVFQTFPVR